MNEILVPLSPADAIDRLAKLKLQVEEADDPKLMAILTQQRDILQRTIDRIFPENDAQKTFPQLLYEIYADLHALEADMCACETRSDFGPAFVALTRSYLTTLKQRDKLRTDIDHQLRNILGTANGSTG